VVKPRKLPWEIPMTLTLHLHEIHPAFTYLGKVRQMQEPLMCEIEYNLSSLES
jgi:hypothetical protein